MLQNSARTPIPEFNMLGESCRGNVRLHGSTITLGQMFLLFADTYIPENGWIGHVHVQCCQIVLGHQFLSLTLVDNILQVFSGLQRVE